MSSSEEITEMPFLKNIGLMVTYKCQVACPHCIIKAGPHRTEALSNREAFEWINQVASFRDGYIKILSLTGGEPFYDLDLLKKVAEHGASRGLFISAVTNAYWASSVSKATEILRRLPEIRAIAISTDTYHLESISFARVKNAIRAAKKMNLVYNISVCTESYDDPQYRALMRQLTHMGEQDNVRSIITFPVGRAQEMIEGHWELTERPPISACTAANSPILFPDGRVVACIGPIVDLKSSHPLLLGNLREMPLATMFDRAELNPILQAIRIWGPHKLITMAKESGLGSHLPDSYVKDSMCSACYYLMANPAIVRYLKELSSNPEFIRKVSFARVYYLKELEMYRYYAKTIEPH
jgi:MoaA/NifB/PqqE/SkfB family radical SAM enzyme